MSHFYTVNIIHIILSLKHHMNAERTLTP